MIKKLFSVLSLFVVMAFAVTSVTMTSCVEDNNTNVEPVPVKEGDFAVLGTTPIKDSDGKEIADAAIVEYVSVGPDMKTLQSVSGIISLPRDPKNLVGIVIDNHYTISKNAECPSLAGGTDAGKMAAGQFCVVSTDYIGFGITAKQLHPYLDSELCAHHAVVLAKIAVEILAANNITGLKLFNMGYSQGGGVALAVHRELEQDPTLAKKLGFVGSWCGDGVYDVEATTKFYLDNADNVSYPVALPLLVEGFLASAPASLKGELKFADFFTDKMISAGLESWMRERNLTTTEINKKMADVVGGGTLKVSDIFKPEMSVESGALMQKYLQFARMHDISKGWTPKYPLRLIHMQYDDVVPVVNAEHAAEGLHLDPEAVTYSPLPLSHADFGPAFYGMVILELMGVLSGGK